MAVQDCEAVLDCDCDCPTRCQAIRDCRFPRTIPAHRVPLAAIPLAEALDCLAQVVRWQLMQLPTSAECRC